MIVTTSWDDGDVLDQRLAGILDRYGIPGTFYITRTWRSPRLSEAGIRALAGRHEIGAHTLNHPDLTLLSRTAKRDEIEGSKKWLEDIVGEPVSMFCYPFGHFDDETKTVVAEAGFRGARTTQQFVVTPGQDRFAVPTTLHVHPIMLRRGNARDFATYLFRARLASRWQDSLHITASTLRGWKRFSEVLFRSAAFDDSSIFHLWGHSWEIEERNMWTQLDALLHLMSDFGCRFQRNGDIQ
jgi:peptidoglycan-N-acetylglucosamine deacetylase